MKLSMAQIHIGPDMPANEAKTLEFCDRATDSDLLFFPEVQYAPFFPQYPKHNVDPYVLTPKSPEVRRLQEKALEHGYYLSPNLFLQFPDEKRYDSSLWINPKGELVDIATMVHIFNAPNSMKQITIRPLRMGSKSSKLPLAKSAL